MPGSGKGLGLGQRLTRRSISVSSFAARSYQPGDRIEFEGEIYLVTATQFIHDEIMLELKPLTLRDMAKLSAFSNPSLSVPYPTPRSICRTPSKDWNW